MNDRLGLAILLYDNQVSVKDFEDDFLAEVSIFEDKITTLFDEYLNAYGGNENEVDVFAEQFRHNVTDVAVDEMSTLLQDLVIEGAEYYSS